jgi:hypothetical protein
VRGPFLCEQIVHRNRTLRTGYCERHELQTDHALHFICALPGEILFHFEIDTHICVPRRARAYLLCRTTHVYVGFLVRIAYAYRIAVFGFFFALPEKINYFSCPRVINKNKGNDWSIKRKHTLILLPR